MGSTMNNLLDRFLRIEILADSVESSYDADAEGCQCFTDSSRNHKYQNEVAGKENAVDIMASSVEQILLYDNPETANNNSSKNQNKEEPTSCETADGDNPDMTMDCNGILKVTTLHVSSAVLAGKSPFFCKLFSNGMKESNQRYVSLRIDASEEAAFMDLLNFIQSDALTATTVSALVDILKAADKFEVRSCLEYCSHLLFNMPMTMESAVQYLELPPSVQIEAAIHPLVDAAKRFLAASYKDVRKCKDKIWSLPLVELEAILSSDDLQVASEDALYDIVMEWARIHYPELEDRREILTSSLGRYIRFPYMSFRRLKKILSCNDFDDEFASRVVLEALIFKAEAPRHQRTLAAGESISTSRRFVERDYKYRPIKVIEFDHPCQQCVVYLDLKRQECKTLYPSRRIYSQAFQLGGQVFFLSASCNFDEKCAFHCFGLFLGMNEKSSMTFEIKYEFSARSKLTEEFICKYKGNYTLRGGKAVGTPNLFGVPWHSFMAEDSLYFIDGILHLRAELTIRR